MARQKKKTKEISFTKYEFLIKGDNSLLLKSIMDIFSSIFNTIAKVNERNIFYKI